MSHEHLYSYTQSRQSPFEHLQASEHGCMLMWHFWLPQCLSLCILADILEFRGDEADKAGPHQRVMELKSWESYLGLQRAQGPCTRGVCCPTHELSSAAMMGFKHWVLGCLLSEWSWIFCVWATVYILSPFSFRVLYLRLLTKEINTLPKVMNVFFCMSSECFVSCKHFNFYVAKPVWFCDWLSAVQEGLALPTV